ncbi:hypothetical protein EYF80_000847 [Liparis tanakae]|uniref:Uncharacterized protein n=1 Tax=Liparis tanakae TaxID=230148 RepID=A0A4Z2JFD6_9TELE|nr:hypothetical protein EYF80_000847 [Liparis tanakae]
MKCHVASDVGDPLNVSHSDGSIQHLVPGTKSGSPRIKTSFPSSITPGNPVQLNMPSTQHGGRDLVHKS